MGKPSIVNLEINKNKDKLDNYNNYYSNQKSLSSNPTNSAYISASNLFTNGQISQIYPSFSQVQASNKPRELSVFYNMDNSAPQYNALNSAQFQNEPQVENYKQSYQEAYHHCQIPHENQDTRIYPEYNCFQPSTDMQGVNHNNLQNTHPYGSIQLYNNSYEKNQNTSYNFMTSYYTQTCDSKVENRSVMPFNINQAQYSQINNNQNGMNLEYNSQNSTESPPDSSNNSN